MFVTSFEIPIIFITGTSAVPRTKQAVYVGHACRCFRWFYWSQQIAKIRTYMCVPSCRQLSSYWNVMANVLDS
jgi:hypothetical protein